jgi:GT2 family glycosyltransferase
LSKFTGAWFESIPSRWALISIVVLNLNGKRYLDECLESLRRQTRTDFEVILVDNGSIDGSLEHLEEHFPEVRIVRNGANLGFAGGTNSGIRQAEGDYVITLNNDTRADSRFVERLMGPVESDELVGMCASKMLFPDGRINSTGICVSRSGAAWDRGMFEADDGQCDLSDDIFGPCAGAALYSRKMLDEIGLFDEDFFLYMEDVDLAFRARLAGWKCVYVPEAVVYHHHGGTAGFGSDISVYYGNRNIVWYPLKDFPLRLLLRSLPWIVGRNLAVIPYYMSMGQGKTILRSKLDAIRFIPHMLKKRDSIVRRVPDHEIGRYVSTWSHIPRK